MGDVIDNVEGDKSTDLAKADWTLVRAETIEVKVFKFESKVLSWIQKDYVVIVNDDKGYGN